jgi:hypothetical protein
MSTAKAQMTALEAETQAMQRTLEYEFKILRFQGVVAFSLIVVFGIVLITSLFLFTSTEVIGIAGVFASWITAIIAFFFVDRGARTTVTKVAETSQQSVLAKETEARGRLSELNFRWSKALQKQYEDFDLAQKRKDEQYAEKPAEKDKEEEPRGMVIE